MSLPPVVVACGFDRNNLRLGSVSAEQPARTMEASYFISEHKLAVPSPSRSHHV
jgi:hypothetical protein